MKVTNIHEAKTHFSKLVDRAAAGEEIVIGKAGSVLKQAGTLARQELRELLGERVHLELWVKVREHWADNERELQRLGFEV